MKKKKMTLEEAKEILKFRQHCLKHALAGNLYVYGKTFRKAMKILKKEQKK